jgi:hypothetical protein
MYQIACQGGAPPTHALYSGLATVSVGTAHAQAMNAVKVGCSKFTHGCMF